MFGYNPPIEPIIGMVLALRQIMCPTTESSIFKFFETLPIEYEQIIQALGRMARWTDSPCLLMLNESIHFSSLRFASQSCENAPRELEFMNESFQSRTTPPIVMTKRGDSHLSNHLFEVDFDGKIEIDGISYALSENPRGMKSVGGIVMRGKTVSAHYFSDT